MLDSLKRLTKHSAVYGFGHVVSRVVNFLLLPLYTHKIATEDFGAFAVVYAFIALMTVVYPFGIDAAFLRYFILSDDKQKSRQIFSTAFWTIFIASCLLSILIYVYAAPIATLVVSNPSRAYLFRLSSLILLFDTLAFLPFLYLRAMEKSFTFVLVKFVNVLINVGLNILFIVYMAKGVEGIFLANVWASGVTFVVLLPVLFKHISPLFSRPDFGELLRFGLPYLPSTLAVVLLDLVDRFILEKMAGLDVTGLYQAGYKLGMFMALFVTAFRFAWHPFFLSTSKQEDAKAIFSKVLTYFTTVGALIFLTVSLFIDEIVRLKIFGFTLFGAAYWQSTRIVPTILLSYLIYGIYVNFIVGIHLEKKTKYLPMITGMGTAINVLANILLIPKFGMMGSAYATVLGYGVMATTIYFVSQRFYAVHYEFGRLLKLAGVVSVLFYLGYYFQTSWETPFKLLLLLGFPFALILTGFFDRREMAKLRGLLSGKAG